MAFACLFLTNPFLPALSRSWCWVAWARQAAPASWQLGEKLLSGMNTNHLDQPRPKSRHPSNKQNKTIVDDKTYLKAVTQAFLWGSSVSQSATFLPSAECPAVANNEELPPWKRGNTFKILGSTADMLDLGTWKTKSAVFFPCVCIVKKGTAVEAA